MPLYFLGTYTLFYWSCKMFSAYIFWVFFYTYQSMWSRLSISCILKISTTHRCQLYRYIYFILSSNNRDQREDQDKNIGIKSLSKLTMASSKNYGIFLQQNGTSSDFFLKNMYWSITFFLSFWTLETWQQIWHIDQARFSKCSPHHVSYFHVIPS